MPESIAPTDAARLTRQARKILASFPEVLTAASELGRPDDGTDVNGFNTAEIAVPLRPREEWTTAHDRIELCARMKEKFDAIPGIDVDFKPVHRGQRQRGDQRHQKRTGHQNLRPGR